MNCVTVGRRTTIQVSGAMQDDVRGPAPPFLTRSRDGGRCGQQDVGSPHTVLEAHFNTDGSCGPGGANSEDAETLPSAPSPTLSPPARHLAGAGGSIAGAISLAELAEHVRETTPVSSPVSRCSLQARQREEASMRQDMLDLSQTLRDGIPLFRSSAEVTVWGRERVGAQEERGAHAHLRTCNQTKWQHHSTPARSQPHTPIQQSTPSASSRTDSCAHSRACQDTTVKEKLEEARYTHTAFSPTSPLSPHSPRVPER